MARMHAGAVGFAFATLVFVVTALLPLFRGGSLNATFLALAVVFFVLAIGVARQRPPPPGPGA